MTSQCLVTVKGAVMGADLGGGSGGHVEDTADGLVYRGSTEVGENDGVWQVTGNQSEH